MEADKVEGHGAVAGQVERSVRPAVAEALRLAEKMMRDSWATGDDKAWRPGYEALRAHLDAMLLAEREAAARTRTKAPRELRPVGTGALLGEQQFCFSKGWKEGRAELRRAIRERA